MLRLPASTRFSSSVQNVSTVSREVHNSPASVSPLLFVIVQQQQHHSCLYYIFLSKLISRFHFRVSRYEFLALPPPYILHCRLLTSCTAASLHLSLPPPYILHCRLLTSCTAASFLHCRLLTSCTAASLHLALPPPYILHCRLLTSCTAASLHLVICKLPNKNENFYLEVWQLCWPSFPLMLIHNWSHTDRKFRLVSPRVCFLLVRANISFPELIAWHKAAS